MNKKYIAFTLCGATLVFLVTVTVIQTIAMFVSYDRGTNYFVEDAQLPTIAAILVFIGFFFAIAAACVIPKKNLKGSPFGLNLACALPATIGFLISAVFHLMEFVETRSTLKLITAIFLTLAALYNFLTETNYGHTHAQTIALLGFMPTTACAFLIGSFYFDPSMEMNAPLKVFIQCALLVAMLYYTTELRYLIKRAIPRLYYALALCAMVAASLCMLSIPLATLFGVLRHPDYLTGSLTVLGIAITIALRAARYPTVAPQKFLLPTQDNENDPTKENAE
jgi:hypothetical protein